jgi:hypothetical protein
VDPTIQPAVNTSVLVKRIEAIAAMSHGDTRDRGAHLSGGSTEGHSPDCDKRPVVGRSSFVSDEHLEEEAMCESMRGQQCVLSDNEKRLWIHPNAEPCRTITRLATCDESI